MSCLEWLPRESLFCLSNMAAQRRFAKLHLSKALDSWNNVLWTVEAKVEIFWRKTATAYPHTSY